MNKEDRENLNFILKQGRDDPAELERWFSSLSVENQEYAVNLLKTANDNLRYAIAISVDTEITNTTEASTYLQKFRL